MLEYSMLSHCLGSCVHGPRQNTQSMRPTIPHAFWLLWIVNRFLIFLSSPVALPYQCFVISHVLFISHSFYHCSSVCKLLFQNIIVIDLIFHTLIQISLLILSFLDNLKSEFIEVFCECLCCWMTTCHLKKMNNAMLVIGANVLCENDFLAVQIHLLLQHPGFGWTGCQTWRTFRCNT
jgi:hypothetical protein